MTMADRPCSSLRKLLCRNSSDRVASRSTAQCTQSLRRLDSSYLDKSSSKPTLEASSTIDSTSVAVYELLRVTRKKARTRKFTIAADSGAVSIDGNFKFSVDMIHDMRIAYNASHYRELCRISAEHEARWLTIIYHLDNSKLKVLHVICPSIEKLESFYAKLSNLRQERSRYLGTGQALFGNGLRPLDEHMWYNLAPNALSSGRQNRSDGSQPVARPEEPRMSLSEVEVLFQKLSFNTPTNLLHKTFKQVDQDNTGYLDFSAFKKFVELLKVRHDITRIYNRHRASQELEMTRAEFLTFLTDVQGLPQNSAELHKIFERAREPTPSENKETISTTNFAAYITSRHNALLTPFACDYTRPLYEYFISSSHNTYLSGRQIGDESSIEPYIRTLQKGCRCIEIDIWSNSENYPEVRHGRAFTSAVSLESVLRMIDKYAFIVSPWPLIISLEIQCGLKAQEIVAELLVQIFGNVLVTARADLGSQHLPSPEALRHRIVLKVKSEHVVDASLSKLVRETLPAFGDPSLTSTEVDESSVSASNPESETDHQFSTSRSSSVSSRSSSFSASRPAKYIPFTRSPLIHDDLIVMAPYCRGIKFRNFSLPETKTFNHTLSLSERRIKQFPPETSVQAMKHNTKFLMRIYPSPTRILSSNFLPHQFWQQGVQMVAMNWQTQDLGLRMNDAFFLTDEHSSDISGYVLKPAAMRHWEKGQEYVFRQWPRINWVVEIVSGTQLPRPHNTSGKVPLAVEMEVVRPISSHQLRISAIDADEDDKDRESRFRSCVVEDNGFNPWFGTEFHFTMFKDEDPYFTFLRFIVRDTASNDILGQSLLPLNRIQEGYRSVGLSDLNGERFLFSSLLIKTSNKPAFGTSRLRDLDIT